jgi:glycosyltransferase involved in cell wall biosynthesis
LKIALLTDGITPFVTGGMQRHSANLAKYLTLSGCQVTLVHCLPFGMRLPLDNVVNEAVFGNNSTLKLAKIISLNFPKSGKIPGQYIRNSFRYSEQIFSSIKDELNNFDVVLVKGFCGWKLQQEKQLGLNCPPIAVNFHGYEMYQITPNFRARLAANMLRKVVQPILDKADIVMSYGGKITELIQNKAQVPQNKIIELPGGIDGSWISKENKAVHQPIGCVFVGRYERRKGIEELHSAIANLSTVSAIQFTFIGPIPEEKRLKQENVQYVGEIKDIESLKKLLLQQDVLICPSYSEGMPNVILEAMACGLAIVATDVGAVNTLVAADNGYLLTLPSVQNIQHAINGIVANRDQLAQMKANSGKKIDYFQWEAIGKLTVEKLKLKLNEIRFGKVNG